MLEWKVQSVAFNVLSINMRKGVDEKPSVPWGSVAPWDGISRGLQRGRVAVHRSRGTEMVEWAGTSSETELDTHGAPFSVSSSCSETKFSPET